MAGETHVNVGGTWYKSKGGWVKVSGVWRKINTIFIKQSGVWEPVKFQIELPYTSSDNNIDLFTEAGSPTGSVDLVVDVAASVIIGSANTSTPAMYASSPLPAGSSLLLTNLGRIQGAGGVANSGAGGIALQLPCDAEVINTSGEIWGGGGAGGKGAGFSHNLGSCGEGCGCSTASSPGGNGGAGAGTVAQAGASATSGGSGQGAGCAVNNCGQYALGATGGNGGNPGAAGSAGRTTGCKNSSSCGGGQDYGCNAGGNTGGGAAGKAVDLNGHSITWNSQGDTKGAIS